MLLWSELLIRTGLSLAGWTVAKSGLRRVFIGVWAVAVALRLGAYGTRTIGASAAALVFAAEFSHQIHSGDGDNAQGDEQIKIHEFTSRCLAR
jgi:hypothetical protein